MTGSDTLVGFVSGLIQMGWLLPQLIVGRMVQHMSHKKPVYAVSGAVRFASWASIALVILLLSRDHPALAFWLFALLLFVGSVAGGVGGVPFLDIVGKTIGNDRRGDLFARRQFFGGLLGLGAALKDKTFGKLYLYHVLSSFSLMAVPFYVLHAKEHLGSTSIVGISLVVTMVTRLVVARPWARLSSKGRYRRALSAAAYLRVLTPLLALVTPLLPDRLLFSVSHLNVTVHVTAFAGLFALLAASLSADVVANTPYLLAIAPEQTRPTYVGVMNTMIAPLVLLPKLLGGILADWLGGYEYAMAFSAVLAAFSLYAASRLPERPTPSRNS
jgi:hypothetical protein